MYDHYATRLFSFGMRYTHSKEKSEELVEDTFVWLWTNREHILQHQSLHSILFLRMRHYLINAYRSTVNSPVFEDYVDYMGSLPCSTNDRLEYDDFVNMVNQAIDRLPDTQTKIVRMSRMDMMSNKEIADALGLKEQTVKNQLSLALKSLRQSLGPTYFTLFFLFFVN